MTPAVPCADYHLHVHVAHVDLDGGQGMAVGKAHLLDDVIGAAPPQAAAHGRRPCSPSSGRRMLLGVLGVLFLSEHSLCAALAGACSHAGSSLGRPCPVI